MMLPLTCIATYEKSHFDRYVMTAPLGRTEAALSHYVFAIICELALSLIGFILSIALGMSVMEALFSSAACFCVGVVMVSVLLPVIYKFGTEKARLTMVAVFVLFLIAFGVLLGIMDIDIDNVEDALVLLPRADAGRARRERRRQRGDIPEERVLKPERPRVRALRL